MAKSDRIDNPVLREYLYKFVPEKLNNNPIFAKVFGEEFANHRLRKNMLYTYSNEPVTAKGYVGYHNGAEKSVTFCSSGENGALLSQNDIAKNEDLQETAIHESVHAIMERSGSENRSIGTMSGTGLLEIYQNGVELGRGLNEGYTEWMCEKAGYKTRAYPELTNFIRLLEVSIGTEKTMELGKGGIKQKFPELLGISRGEVEILFARADQLYIENDRLQTAQSLKNIIMDYTYAKESGDDDNKKKEKERYDLNQGLINYYLTDPQYKAFLEKDGAAVSNETLEKYLSEVVIPKAKEQGNIEIIEIESFILNRYFIRDLKRVFESEEVSRNDFENISKIVSLLNTGTYNIPEMFKENKDTIAPIYVIQNYQKLADKFIEITANEEAQKYKDGKLGLKSFIENIKELSKSDVSLSKKMIDKFLGKVCPEDQKRDFEKIIDRAWKFSDNEVFMQKVLETSIYSLESQDSERKIKTSIVYDKENFYDRFGSETTTVDSIDGKADFDFTAELDGKDEYSITMENFKQLQNKVFNENPNAKIHIVLRTIIVQNGEEQSFYYIDKGELVPMQVQSKTDLQFQPEEKQIAKEEVQMIPVKVGFFANLINKIRRRMNEYKNKGKEEAPNFVDENVGRIMFEQPSRPIDDDKLSKYRVENYNQMAEKSEKQEVEQEQTQDEQR